MGLFTKIVLVLPALLLFLEVSNAMEAETILKALNGCLSKTDEKIDFNHMFELPRTPGEKCVAVCLTGALKILADDGSFDRPVFRDFLVTSYGQSDKIAKIGEECMKSPPKVDLNDCESINSLIDCFDVEASKITLERKALLAF